MTTAVVQREQQRSDPSTRDELERFRQDFEYLRSNRGDLTTKHADMWVAVLGKSVVGSHVDLEKLLADLDLRGIDKDKALVDFLSSAHRLFIL
ncbi:MAG: hypothetical protein WEB00_09760 [Dehalococcoidia bacterium]